MQNFNFYLQRFSAVYEFTTGTLTFTDSSYAYYWEPNNKSNQATLTIGYNIDWLTDIVGNSYSVQGSYITIPGDHRILRGMDLSNRHANYVQMYGTGGKDEINNAVDSPNVTIDGGDDDDTITNNGDKASINGGDGNDSIENWGVNVLINGGIGGSH